MRSKLLIFNFLFIIFIPKFNFTKYNSNLNNNSSCLKYLNKTRQFIGGTTPSISGEQAYTAIISAPTVYKNSVTTATSGTVVTLDKPGRYLVESDLEFAPANNSVIGIQITSSNVTLDLNDCTLYQTGSGTSFTVIKIATGLSNITVRNGKINSITGTGTHADTNCSNVRLREMSINGCSTQGMLLSTCDNCLIMDIQITNCNTTSTNDPIGLELASCTSITAIDSIFNNNTNTSGSGTAYGVKMTGCKNCNFQNCQANGNQGDIAYGFSLTSSCESCTLRHCLANNNVADGGTTNDDCVGYYLNASKSCHLYNCDANSNTSTSSAFGFKTINSNVCKFKACEAAYNSTTATTTGPYGAWGFCSSHTGSASNVWVDCRANGNQGSTDAGATDTLAVGIEIGGTEKYSNIANCVSSRNNGHTGTGYGIRINGATLCEVKANRVVVNIGDSSDPNGGFRIKDTSADTTNLYTSNFAFGNGKADNSVVNNYDVAVAPDNNVVLFPSVIGYLNNFNNFNPVSSFQYNIEVIERQ